MAIGITFAGTILANSLIHISSSKDRIIAVNLAREGLEAVRNIRDTNWLKFSGNRRECWNHLPGTLPPPPLTETCDGSALIEPGTYLVYKDENQRWRLLLLGDREAWLYWMDIDSTVDSNADGNNINDRDIFNPTLTPPPGNGDDPLGHRYAEKSIFQRLITLSYLEEAQNRMAVTSTVTWVTSQGESRISLTTHLTDYLGRDNFES